MSRKFSISARHSGFMGVVHEPEVLDQRKTLRIHDVRRAPRPRLAGGGHFPSAVMLCLRHVFLVFPPEGTSPPSTAYFTLSPFLVSRDGRTKKLSVACRLCFWVSQRNGGASRPPLPTVGADHRVARRSGKTGQTGFATTHAVGPFDVWFWFDRISPLL